MLMAFIELVVQRPRPYIFFSRRFSQAINFSSCSYEIDFLKKLWVGIFLSAFLPFIMSVSEFMMGQQKKNTRFLAAVGTENLE